MKQNNDVSTFLFKLEDIITELKEGGASEVRLVTENGLHLRQCLHPRAFNQHINLSEFFYSYIDLQKEYRQFRDKPNGFKRLQEIADGMSNILIIIEIFFVLLFSFFQKTFNKKYTMYIAWLRLRK